MTQALEVLLNTVWLLVAIGAFLFWQTIGRDRAPARHIAGRSCRVVALATALILLFPSISLTDDLHQEQAVMEDCTRSVMKARDLAQGCLRAGKASFHAVLAALPYFAALPRVFAPGAVRLKTPIPALALMCAPEGRAPPSKL